MEFKLRDLAHSGDQVGVPANLKAMEYKPLEKHTINPDWRWAKMTQYIREHDGERMTIKDLGMVAGYSDPAGAHNLINKMTKLGKLVRIRRGKGKGWTYKLLEAKTDSRENGPVVIREAQPRVEEKQEAVVKHFNDERRQRSILYSARLNADIWDFLKDAGTKEAYGSTALGETTRALSKFASYVGAKLEKEVSNDES